MRRKFLRQNRDIARVNSSQSLRIRGLENECARLLSENLDLRGQVARLEKELEDSSAQRIADHALDIKAKLEAQLIEWGSLLAGLGLEPPMKRHSPLRRRISKPRPSLGRSPARKPLRNTARDAEALAAEEGRLPSIPENRLYPRQTLKHVFRLSPQLFSIANRFPVSHSREEILALCSEAADSTDSPDLGPPPVSRFVDEDPIKLDSPCRPGDGEDGNAAVRTADSPKASSPVPVIPARLDFSKRAAVDPEKKKQRDAALSSQPPRPVEQQPASQPASQPPRAGSKRKLGVRDENENAIGNGVRGVANHALPKLSAENAQGPRDLKTRKSIKDISASRTEARDKAGSVAMTNNERRPLAAKSTNEDVSSPRKAAKSARPLDEIAAKKMEVLRVARARDRAKEPAKTTNTTAATAVANAVVPEPQPEPEPATPLVNANLSTPDTPQRSAARGSSRDTPPPADISSQGETSRPSRRARASVSYAEPSLRAKMRRPTKELLDAVAGEGKYLQRQQKTDDEAPPPSVTGGGASVRADPDEGGPTWKQLPAAAPGALEREAAARRHALLSPLSQKEAAADILLPSSVVTERRKRGSSFGVREGVAAGGSMPDLRKVVVSSIHHGEDETSRGPSPAPEDDPYEFNISSPAAVEPRAARASVREAAAARGGQKPSRQLSSSATMQDVSSSKVSKPSGPRKRASMAAPKKPASLLDDDNDVVDDDSYEPPRDADTAGARELSARDRISRRRSMML